MNCDKDATVGRFYHESHDQLRRHFANFVAAHDLVGGLKTLNGLSHTA